MAGILDSVDQRTRLVGQNRLEILVFRLAGRQQFAINVFKVQEVLQLPRLTLIPQRHPMICGVINLRGQTLPVIDLSHAIGTVLEGAGYPVNVEFGGHGIGSTMHQDPHVANTGRPGRGYTLRPGLLLALEPWVMADTDVLVTDPDGWTLRSATGARTAQTEHTIAITDDGAEVLTLPR